MKGEPTPPLSSVGSVEDLRTGGGWGEPLALPIFFLRIDDSHCDTIHSSVTAENCSDDAYERKQPVALKEYCVEMTSTD